MAQSDSHSDASVYRPSPSRLGVIDWVALTLLIFGALNWGLIGAIGVYLVAAMFGNGTPATRAVYLLVGLAALYGFVMMARLGREPGN
jgi:uncharacterized membrane protein YuzA (DUF378 family)